MARLDISLLGPLEVRLDGQAVTGLAYDKVWALLAYLVVEADRPHRRDALIGLLWPDQLDRAARTNLRQALTQLRQAIGDHIAQPPFLLIERETIQFNRASDYDLDVASFSALLDTCDAHPHRHPDTCTACARRRGEAAQLYRGNFLAEFFLKDAVAFEEWALLKREELHQRASGALALLVAYYERRGAYENARHYAQRLLQMDPWNEVAHRQVMRVFARTGQRSAALHQYGMCRRALADGLGVEPEAETTALYEQIKRGDEQAAVRVERPPTNMYEHTPSNTFVGREVELEQLAERLEQCNCRLLTLLGPGGIGKTRLAQQLANELRDSFGDGVWFVPLAAISNPAMVVTSIAETFGITETPGQPLMMHLKRYLGAKELLLVLDNFEQVVDAGSLIAELLARAPHLAVVITSRAVLHLSGEQEFEVPPLALPDRHHLPAPVQLIRYESVRLFIERAQAVKPGFAVTYQNASAVAEICNRLDGLPLAIELAAAWIKLLPPAILLEQLNPCLPLLTGGACDLPARQQTLRNTIDWSYNLLTTQEQTLFRRLGAFAGGCTIEAAEAVASEGEIQKAKGKRDASDTSFLPLTFDLLPLIAALVDKSLLRQEEGLDGPPRFMMLQTVREYALERLEQSGELESTRQRHAEHFLALAEAAEPELRGPHQLVYLKLLEAEHDNLRAALGWVLTQTATDIGMRLVAALWWFWLFRAHFSEGRGWLAEVQARSGADAPLDERRSVWAKALAGAGILAFYHGDNRQVRTLGEQSLAIASAGDGDESRALTLLCLSMAAETENDFVAANNLGQESLALFRAAGSAWSEAFALLWLGGWAADQGDNATAHRLCQESLRLFRILANPWGQAAALHGLGMITHHQGNYDQAIGYATESLSLARRLGDHYREIGALSHLAYLAGLQEQYAQAEAYLVESLVLTQKLGNKELLAWQHYHSAALARRRGDQLRARRCLVESLRQFQEQDDQFGSVLGMAACLELMAEIIESPGSSMRVVRLFAAAAGLREIVGTPLFPEERIAHDRTIGALRAQLGDVAFAGVWAAGRAMAVEQVIVEVFGDEGSSYRGAV